MAEKMRIVHLLPGSGDTFYCQNCIRDLDLVRQLRKTGHDVVMTPMYLPLWKGADEAPVFFGGLNSYLQQVSRFFRKTPRWVDRIFDARFLLKLLASRAGSTSAAGLEGMTLSMLNGVEGNQAKELNRLIDWLEAEGGADVIHFSTSLLLGLAPEIRRRLGCVLVCSLQDEANWVDSMRDPGRTEVWNKMKNLVGTVDFFTASSRYYGGIAAERMSIPQEKIKVVYPGIPLGEYTVSPNQPVIPTIGYLARATSSLGLGVLVDAFINIRRQKHLSDLKLRVAGGATAGDAGFLREIRAKLSKEGALEQVEFLPVLEREERVQFLQSLSVLSVPSPEGEAFGLHIIESWACGVPVVQPRTGAYTELVEATGGGILCEPGNVDSLSSALAQLLNSPEKARMQGAKGREGVEKLLRVEDSAKSLINIYESALVGRKN